MSVSFPLSPQMQFYDATGGVFTVTSPILHRFLHDLWLKTGGGTTEIEFEPIFSELNAKNEISFEDIEELQTDLPLPQDFTEILEAVSELQIQLEQMRSNKIDNYARRYALLMS